MHITREGFAVLENDSHGSPWIEQHGQIDYGLRVADTFRRWVSPGDTVVDAGAFVGDHAVPIASIVGPTGHVHSFEPFEETREALLYNARHLPQITVYDCALGDVDGAEMAMKRGGIVGDGRNVGATCVVPAEDGDGLPRVHVRRMDAIQIPPRVSLLRMDVEGFELAVMRGAERTILRDRPVIVFEVSGHYARVGVTRAEVFAWLAERGYRIENADDDRYEQYDAVALPG